jgi:hypothetical protein
MATASPAWSKWSCVRSRRSAAGAVSTPPGAFGFPSNHGSIRAVFPSRMEKPECPNQRIRTDAMASSFARG